MNLRSITWVGSSRHDLVKLPVFVQREIGFSLHQIQEGKTPKNAKTLKVFEAGVLEIVSDYNKNTYRAVYAIKLGNDIYVLHVFHKKSKQGIKTPKQDLDLIRSRLAIAKRNIKEE